MASHAITEEKIGKSVTSHKSRKFMNVTIYFLDDSSHVFQIQAKALGQILFEKTCKFLNLLEVDYFCLEFEDEKGIKCWLDVLKPMYSQIPTLFPTMYFRVKFYSPDPAQLEDELTRYLFGLQIRKDLATGLLQCNNNTAAVIISYIVQADLGDHDQKKCLDSSYFSSNKFLPLQDSEIERKVVENHMKLIGQTPAETDLNLLETARRCELYGIKMTPAKDHEGVPINLAVSHTGVSVFQNLTKITTFSWPKIRKLSFKRKKFLVKLHPDGFGNFKDPTEFLFDGRNECKNFWKKCIENHTFFRCTDAKQGMRQKPKIFSRGSSFRYSGRTQKQVTDFVRENCFKRQPFQRSTSLRTASSSSSPTRALGTFTSAQPLIPVSSQSCGSISDAAKEPPPPVFSTSEPTTPHVAQEVIRSLNNNGTTPDSSKGLISPDFVSQQEGFQSPDFLSQDTDDNISHDSYHVVETNLADCMQTNPDNIAGGDNRADGDCMAHGGSNTMGYNEVSDSNKKHGNFEKNGNILNMRDNNNTTNYSKEENSKKKSGEKEIFQKCSVQNYDQAIMKNNKNASNVSGSTNDYNVHQGLITDDSCADTENSFEKISNVVGSDNLNDLMGSKYQVLNSSDNNNIKSYSKEDQKNKSGEKEIFQKCSVLNYNDAVTKNNKDASSVSGSTNVQQDLITEDSCADTESSFDKISNIGSSDNLSDHLGSKYQDNSDMTSSMELTDALNTKPLSDSSSIFAHESQKIFGSSKFYYESSLSKSLISHKKTPTDKTYFLTKELLMTERTYRKDLEIINVMFREEFNKQDSLPHSAIDLMLSVIDPLYEIHCSLLRDMEQRLALWEGRKTTLTSVRGIGEIILNNKSMSQMYSMYFNQLPKILKQLAKELDSSQYLATFYQKFEANKICYLPLTSFLLRPIFRLSYYCSLVKTLLQCSDIINVDHDKCQDALLSLKDAEEIENNISPVVNFVKLMELQRILIGFQDILQDNREFIREGCLLKLSNKGSRQYMFFLFSDILLYATRVHSEKLHFKVQGKLQLHHFKVEETAPMHGVNNCFLLSSPDKCFIIAANSKKDCSAWVSDLSRAIQNAKNLQNEKVSSQSRKLDDSEDGCESSDDDPAIQANVKLLSHHVNTSVHVCWHRNISIGFGDLLFSMKYCLSGYLLRKFKNNDGWQKLWVVLSNRCLFFYKSFQDESPLASLPLAGYQVLTTSSTDPVEGKCIFKLQYKNHCYFFKAESEHTFERWIEVVYQCSLMEEEKTHL